MAVFPQGLTNIDQRCKGGERRVLHALKRCLEDDYLVWHDVPIGAHARQPDFVILSPRWGLLLLEVKSWKPHTFGTATKDRIELRTTRGLVVEKNPHVQVREDMWELVDVMRRDPALAHASGPFRGHLLFPYGCGIVLAGLRRADIADCDDLGLVFPPQRTMLRDDLEDDVDAASFQNRLWGMFNVRHSYTLTLPQRDRIRWHLFPEVRLRAQAAFDFADDGDTPAMRLPDLMQVMDLQQEQVARSLGEGHRVIHGPAGSGKTMILMFRAEQLAKAARVEQPILVLCFNRSLAGRIDSLLRQRGIDERVIVRSFHAWCQDMVRSYQLDVPRADGPTGDDYYAALTTAVENAVRRGRVPGGQYSALLIDEAHDFEEGWLRIAAQMVHPSTSSLLVLYDDAQSIYQKKRRGRFSFASVGIDARGRTSVLRLNYRNTAEVLAVAMQCVQHLMTEGECGAGDDVPATIVPASAGRRGRMPVLLVAADEADEALVVAERIAHALSDGVAANEIAVLARFPKTMFAPFEQALQHRGIVLQSMGSTAIRDFDWQRDSVKLLSLHSAKGLEFQRVYIVGLQAMPRRGESLDDELRLLYVGMTRATQALVMSTHGESVISQRAQASIAAIQQRFAAADVAT